MHGVCPGMTSMAEPLGGPVPAQSWLDKISTLQAVSGVSPEGPTHWVKPRSFTPSSGQLSGIGCENGTIDTVHYSKSTQIIHGEWDH
jgi:hypothetical protein